MIAAVWGIWNVNINPENLTGKSEVLCAAMSWEGEKEVQFVSSWQHGRKTMLRKIHKLMSDADVIVTYNGDRFDLKILTMEFASVGLPPPAPYKSVDLLKTVKRRFRLPSNKLDFVLKYFGLGQKMKHYGPMLWLDVVAKKPDAQKLMQEYNVRDVAEMKKLFRFLQGWGIVGMPNYAAYDGVDKCPECGGVHFHRRGTRVVNLLTYARYRCANPNCGKWFQGTKALKLVRAQVKGIN